MDNSTYNLVSTYYTTHVTSQNSSSAAHNVAAASAFGYCPSDLASIPATSNLGIACGNPLATSGLKEGEILIDLGSGAGLDCFLASARVGKTGKVFGVDMTESMISLAERNKAKGDYENVSFVKANIVSIPLPSSSADIITSNCVVNLVPSPQKPAVFSEIFRLLKPGGRVAISDILGKKEIPDAIRSDIGLYVGCISGTSKVAEYEACIRGAGFKDVFIIDTEKDVNVYKGGVLSSPVEGSCEGCGAVEGNGGMCQRGCGAPAPANELNGSRREELTELDLNEYIGAYQIYAIKPETET